MAENTMQDETVPKSSSTDAPSAQETTSTIQAATNGHSQQETLASAQPEDPPRDGGNEEMIVDASGKVDAVNDNSISADEIALYDRQIRLWGIQAQEKIRNAHILLINIKALGNEIAKNLVLAGIGSLTVIDPFPLTEDDLASQFLVNEGDIGKPRAEAAAPALRRLNPRVPITVSSQDLSMASPEFYAQFALVVDTDQPWNLFTLHDSAAHFAKVPFYAASSHGLYGFVFADLGVHDFSITRTKSNMTQPAGTAETETRTIISVVEKPEPADPTNQEKITELVTKREVYQPLLLANAAPLPAAYLNNRRKLRQIPQLVPCLRALFDFEASYGRGPSTNVQDLEMFTRLATMKREELGLPNDLLKAEFLRSFMQNLYGELAPTCAVLGGIVAQDVINVLGGREQPVQNMVIFDGDACIAPVYAFVPDLKEGALNAAP